MSIARRRGFSLLELMVACSLFLGMLAVVFFFFRYGTRAFNTATQRQGVQADALRIMDGLQADLKRSSDTSILLANDAARTRVVDGVTVHRDAISFITLKNWSNPADVDNFEVPGGQPKWNRYWVFYATTNADRGQMVRLKVDPSPPPIAPIPLTMSDLSHLIQDDPSLNLFQGAVPAFVFLARNVYDFSVTRAAANEFSISCKLQERRQLRPDGGIIQGVETYQLLMRVRPENTYPQEN